MLVFIVVPELYVCLYSGQLYRLLLSDRVGPVQDGVPGLKETTQMDNIGLKR